MNRTASIVFFFGCLLVFWTSKIECSGHQHTLSTTVTNEESRDGHPANEKHVIADNSDGPEQILPLEEHEERIDFDAEIACLNTIAPQPLPIRIIHVSRNHLFHSRCAAFLGFTSLFGAEDVYEMRRADNNRKDLLPSVTIFVYVICLVTVLLALVLSLDLKLTLII